MLLSQPFKWTTAAILGFLFVAANFPSPLAGQGTVEDPPDFVWTERTDNNGDTYHSGVMEIGEATFVIGGETLTTRAYRQAGGSYTIPGPTMTMVPGNKYVLQFHNTLPFEPLSPDHNVFKDPNVSNLHTHGLRISGESPGDDVTRSFEGGFGGDFVYDIPANHMGGTYWYHAHHHGSTFLQVSGGAFGLLIVDDSNDGIPANVAAMEEREIVLGFLDPNVSGTGGDTLISGTLSPTWTVNGLVGGNIIAPPQTWQHWRVLVADRKAKEKLVEFGPDCEVLLLARDGVWRTSAPKSLTNNAINLTGASRADFAVRVWGDSQLIIDGDVVADITMQGTPDTTVNPFAPGGGMWSATRPSYLRDLRNEPNGDVNFDSISMGARTINGSKFDIDEQTFDKAAMGVQEWSISGATNHPFHLHIYHVQALANTSDFENGEYYDVMAANVDVRFDLSSAYEGRAIMHCHILAHEDRGAMGWMNVIGGIVPPTFPSDSNFSYSEYYSLDVSPTVPDPPSNLSANAVSSSAIDLTWVDNSSNEDGFNIERSLDGNAFDFLSSVGSNAENYTDTGLSAETTYYYRVLAYNANGSSAPSNVATETTPPGQNGTSVEVGSITVTTVNLGRGNKKGRAVVVVVDDLGNPVEGATVIGDFRGDIEETPLFIPLTDANGSTTVDTIGTARGGVSLIFCVTGISHPDLEDFTGQVCVSN